MDMASGFYQINT